MVHSVRMHYLGTDTGFVSVIGANPAVITRAPPAIAGIIIIVIVVGHSHEEEATVPVVMQWTMSIETVSIGKARPHRPYVTEMAYMPHTHVTHGHAHHSGLSDERRMLLCQGEMARRRSRRESA